MQKYNNIRPAQFISIPVLSDEIKANFLKFKNEILEGYPVEGVEPSIFISELKLHLTVSLFTLKDDLQKNKARSLLETYKTEKLIPFLEDKGPLKVKLSGIQSFQRNLTKTRVLYANACLVDENEDMNLKSIIEDINNQFNDSDGLFSTADNLHVTLMNCKYRKSSPKRFKNNTFDASPIINKYKDYYFGECDFNNIRFCYISSLAEDGYYKRL